MTGRSVDRDLRFGERVLLMKQLALMIEAGVPLLEALTAVASGVASIRGRRQLDAVAAALRNGRSFAEAVRVEAPGFPDYLHGMLAVGESSGRLGEVLRRAADQMAWEDRLRRDIGNALVYPAFLACAGLAAIAFILTQVAPRFAAIVGDRAAALPWLSRAVLDLGTMLQGRTWLMLLVLALVVTAAGLALSRPAARAALMRLARRLPVVGPVLEDRDVAIWARLSSFGLAHGVGLMPATAMALRATPPGAFRASLAGVEADLRAGRSLDEALSAGGRLDAMDLGLIRAGQRAGALGEMLGALADSRDARLRDGVKRLTALVEPLAIGGVALLVAVVAFALVTTLSAVYDLTQ